jgi:MFS family permease
MLHGSPASPANEAPVRPSAWVALAVLLLVYVLNFLDRTLIYVLFPGIRKEMAFTDLQLALLGTTSFVIFYTALGIPFGRLADRVSRRKLIAAGLAIWSVFSGITGFASDFWSIFFCRVMVGVGEATLGPAAMSLLASLFPASRRATVQSLFSAGIPVGAAAALFLGAKIAEGEGWRAAFIWLGFPGLALAVGVLPLPEPARDPVVAVSGGSTGVFEDMRTLAAVPALRWTILGYALFAVASNSLSIWVPSLLRTMHDLPLAHVGRVTGLAMLTAGGLATAMGGWVADRFRKRGPAGRLRFTMLLAVVSAPVWGLLAGAAPGSVDIVTAAFFSLAGLGLAWLGPAAADISELAPERLRGLAIAAYFFVVNVVGYGAAPPLLGWISDRLKEDGVGHPMASTLLVACPLACLLAAAALWRAARLREVPTNIDAASLAH